MNPADMGAFGVFLEGFQQRVEDMKKKAAETEVTGEASDGLVKVTVTCDYQVRRVEIAEEAMQDRELLEDLLRAATDEALRQAKETAAEAVNEVAGGLPLPPGLFPT